MFAVILIAFALPFGTVVGDGRIHLARGLARGAVDPPSACLTRLSQGMTPLPFDSFGGTRDDASDLYGNAM
jgi:hypothetical protein